MLHDMRTIPQINMRRVTHGHKSDRSLTRTKMRGVYGIRIIQGRPISY